jgi:hypothetical protein
VEDNAAIKGIDHVLDADDRLSKAEIADLSSQQVSLLVEVIRYRTGYCEVVSQSVSDPAGGASPSATTWTWLHGKSGVQRPAQLPSALNLALRVWLRLAADALQMSPPDAIRNYYMVWEDMGLASPKGSPGEEFRFIRNFVSHGGLLTDPDLLAFLSRELRKPVNQYDPHDTDHQTFLEHRREWARKLSESEIDNYL